MISNKNLGIKLTVCEVLFGLPTNNNPDLKLIHFLILIGKWYLNNSKTQNKPIYLFDFISLIKEKTEILRSVYVNIMNNEEVELWVADLWAVVWTVTRSIKQNHFILCNVWAEFKAWRISLLHFKVIICFVSAIWLYVCCQCLLPSYSSFFIRAFTHIT